MASKKSKSMGKRKSVSGSPGMKASGPRTKKGGGSKLTRTEVVQVRLDPKLRFAAEIASKAHRRTLSSFIEWAVDQAVKNVVVAKRGVCNDSAKDIAHFVWDINEADRFIHLASRYPELLTYDEECLWQLIISTQSIWDNTFSKTETHVGNIHFNNFPVLRYLFSILKSQISNPLPNFEGELETNIADFEALQDEFYQ